jgi:hypothetical protein
MTRTKGPSFQQQFLLEKMMNDSELRFKHVMRVIEKQEDEIQKLKEALRFYANEEHIGWTKDTAWEHEPDDSFRLVDTGYTENGERARKALGLDKKSESMEHREMGK